MIPDRLIGSVRALPPAEAIAAIRRRLDEGGEAGDLATSDVRALLAAHNELTAGLARLRAPADLAAVGARAAAYTAARAEMSRAMSACAAAGYTQSTADLCGDAERVVDDAAHESAADVPTLLALLAAERERHAAEVAGARAAALREAEDACRAEAARWESDARAGGVLASERRATARELADAVAALATKGAPDV